MNGGSLRQELKSINGYQSTKMAPPEENLQNQPVPQIPRQTVVFNDLAGVKAPEFDWHSDDLPGTFKKFKRYCQLMLSTPTYAAGHQRRE